MNAMQIIEPLVNYGPYVENHERWYLLESRPFVMPSLTTFFPVNAAVAHERFVQRWARDTKVEFDRARRDAREQFLARMEAI